MSGATGKLFICIAQHRGQWQGLRIVDWGVRRGEGATLVGQASSLDELLSELPRTQRAWGDLCHAHTIVLSCLMHWLMSMSWTYDIDSYKLLSFRHCAFCRNERLKTFSPSSLSSLSLPRRLIAQSFLLLMFFLRISWAMPMVCCIKHLTTNWHLKCVQGGAGSAKSYGWMNMITGEKSFSRLVDGTNNACDRFTMGCWAIWMECFVAGFIVINKLKRVGRLGGCGTGKPVYETVEAIFLHTKVNSLNRRRRRWRWQLQWW